MSLIVLSDWNSADPSCLYDGERSERKRGTVLVEYVEARALRLLTRAAKAFKLNPSSDEAKRLLREAINHCDAVYSCAFVEPKGRRGRTCIVDAAAHRAAHRLYCALWSRRQQIASRHAPARTAC